MHLENPGQEPITELDLMFKYMFFMKYEYKIEENLKFVFIPLTSYFFMKKMKQPSIFM